MTMLRTLAVLAILLAARPVFAQESLDLIYGMKARYEQVEDYRTIFVRQERIGGKLGEPEEIALDFKRPFMVQMRWLKGPKKGRRLIFVEGENDNKILVSMEGLIGRFVRLLRLDPNGALAKQGGKRSIRQVGLGNLVDSLISLTREAEKAGDLKTALLGEEIAEGRRIYVIERTLPKERYDSPRTLISIDKETGLPVKVLRFNKEGDLFERYEYDALQINQDLSKAVFREKDPFDQSPAEENKTLQDAYRIIREAATSYKKLNDYTATFQKRERIGLELFPEELYEIKFMKPFFLFLKIKKGRYEGTELYYSPEREGKKKLIVRPGGVVGTLLSKVNLDQIPMAVDADPVTKGNRHLISEFGIGYFLERYQLDFEKALKEKDFFVEVTGRSFDGDPGTRIELILKNRKKLPKYYAYRTLVLFSKKRKLPMEIKVFNETGDLIEYYGYRDLKVDTGLRKDDFDPDRPPAEPAVQGTVLETKNRP